MVKSEKNISGKTGDLFQQLETPALDNDNAPPLSLNQELRGAIKQAERLARRHYGYSREIIIDRMNLCLDENDKVTKRKFDAWMAESKEDHNWPAAWLPAFCWAAKTITPFQALLDPIDHEAIDVRDRHAFRLGQLQIEKSQLSREERSLKRRLE